MITELRSNFVDLTSLNSIIYLLMRGIRSPTRYVAKHPRSVSPQFTIHLTGTDSTPNIRETKSGEPFVEHIGGKNHTVALSLLLFPFYFFFLSFSLVLRPSVFCPIQNKVFQSHPDSFIGRFIPRLFTCTTLTRKRFATAKLTRGKGKRVRYTDRDTNATRLGGTDSSRCNSFITRLSFNNTRIGATVLALLKQVIFKI